MTPRKPADYIVQAIERARQAKATRHGLTTLQL